MQKGFTEPQTIQLSLGVARRLSHFLNNWEVITTDKWVLDCVQGFQIPFTSLPGQEHRPNAPTSSAEQSSLILAEVSMLLEKGAVTSVENPSSHKFLLNPVPCSQEGKSDKASYQPQEAEQMGETPALQNGRYGDTQGTTEGERLDSEGGPQRCILHNPNTHRPPTLPEVYSGAGTLSVHMSPIRTVMCPLGIHQSDEARCNLPTRQRGANDSLYRRYSIDGGHCSSGSESFGSIDFPADRPGVHHQCAEVYYYPIPTDRVPGPEGGLSVPTLKSTGRETPPYKDGGQTTPAEATGDSMTTGSTDRETECSFTGSSPFSTSFLLVTTRRPTQSSVSHQPEL